MEVPETKFPAPGIPGNPVAASKGFSETQGLVKGEELRCPRRLLVLPLDYIIGSSLGREEG